MYRLPLVCGMTILIDAVMLPQPLQQERLA